MKRVGLSELIFGFFYVSCSCDEAERMLNTFAECHVIYRGLEYDGTKMTFRIFARDKAYFADCALKSNLEISMGEMRGLPALFNRYRRRYGIMCGIASFALILILSQLFVWNVTVSGNVNVSTENILEYVAAAGCKIGSFIPGIDFDGVYLDVLSNSDELSWISAVRVGTTVRFEVLETKRQQDNSRPQGKANLIAASDGQIEALEIRSGVPAVKSGDVVKKGELLVSGVVDLREDRYKVTHADGNVYAKVAKKIRVSVPLEYEVRRQKSRKICNIGVIFFSKCINISVNSGISPELCDTITGEEWLSLPGLPRLPLCFTVEYAIDYENEVERLNETQAMSLAFNKLENEIAVATSSGELLEKSISAHFEDDLFIIDCDILCIENIAQVSEIVTDG